MRRLLIVGCGDIAHRALNRLCKHYRVFALIRNRHKQESLRQVGATPIIADLDQRASLSRISGLADVVLHFAPPPETGVDDPRTRNLLAALSQGTLPKQLIYISTSGVYGDCQGEWVNEIRPPHAQTARAKRRVAAEQHLRNWAQRHAVNLAILRVPGIYAAERFSLARLQQPCILAEQDSYTNHIHADDLVNIVFAALRHAKHGRIYHACDSSHLKMGDYFDLLAEHFNLPHPPRVSRAQAQTLLSPGLLSFMNESRRLSNQRLLSELKVQLRFPTVYDYLQSTKTIGQPDDSTL